MATAAELENLPLKRRIAREAIRMGSSYVNATDQERVDLQMALSLLVLADQTQDDKDSLRLFNLARTISKKKRK